MPIQNVCCGQNCCWCSLRCPCTFGNACELEVLEATVRVLQGGWGPMPCGILPTPNIGCALTKYALRKLPNVLSVHLLALQWTSVPKRNCVRKNALGYGRVSPTAGTCNLFIGRCAILQPNHLRMTVALQRLRTR